MLRRVYGDVSRSFPAFPSASHRVITELDHSGALLDGDSARYERSPHLLDDLIVPSVDGSTFGNGTYILGYRGHTVDQYRSCVSCLCIR